MSFDLNGLLQQYLNPARATDKTATAQEAEQQLKEHFSQVVGNTSSDTVAQGVTEALASEQTPPFAQLISQLFGKSNPAQRAGMLNQMISGIDPSLLSSLAGGALAALFRSNGGSAAVTPEQAADLSPTTVQQIAADAEQLNPNIVNSLGKFYAQHSALIQSLGGVVLAVALKRMTQGRMR